MATPEFDVRTEASRDELERTINCQPCGNERKGSIAVGYCFNCREYLCRRCYDVHLIPTICKKHVLLDKDHMTEIKRHHLCEQHSERDVEYHCPTHSFLGCHICCFQHQKVCNNTVCIPEICASTITSEAFSAINQQLASITSKCNEFILDMEAKPHKIETNYKATILSIKEYKLGVIDKLDELERELIEKADKVRNIEMARFETLLLNCKTIVKDTEKMSSMMSMLDSQDKTCDLYINFINTKEKIQKIEEDLEELSGDNQINPFMFRANKKLVRCLKSKFALGNLNQKTCFETVKHVRDVSCRSKTDVSTCCITGVVSLPGQRLVVADWGDENKALKVFDMEQYTLQSEIKLSSNPYCICKITDSLLAVTLTYAKKLAFVRTDSILNVEREISVNGEPCGIGYLDGKLVVSYKSPIKVEVMDMQTSYTVSATFETDHYGQALFSNPFRLGINPANNLIYVSNCGSNVITCMRIDGAVVAKYENNGNKLESPRQVSFDSNGMVYVCGEKSNNIIQMTEDCKNVKAILTRANGLNSPCSIFHQENEGRLVVFQRNSDSMKVYQIEYSEL